MTAALFLTQAEAEEKYKVIKETLLQLNVSTAERKKKKEQVGPSGWVCLWMKMFGRRSGAVSSRKSCLYFSLTYTTQTHTPTMFTILMVFGDGLEEA